MLPIASILVPVDFSASCRNAARQAGILARHYSAEVTLLHLEEYAEALAGRSKAELEAFASGDLESIKVHRVMRAGDPSIEILRFANDSSAGLIVMPTHGYGTVRRLLLGSVTAKVLQGAGCPVWTEAHKFATPEAPRKILCGVRFAPETKRTVLWAARFANDFDAQLTIAHAIPSPAAGNISVHRWREEAEQRAEGRIHELLSELGVKAETAILDGFAPDALSAAVAAFATDLLVIGRECAPGLTGRLNSEAYDIIRSCPCPVVSV